MIETLGLLEELGIDWLKERQPHDGIPSAEVIHRVAEAERLAYADRDAYVADPGFAGVPEGGWEELWRPEYLAQRAKLVGELSMREAAPGNISLVSAPGKPGEENGTSHFHIVDAWGNAIAVTASVEAAFGSFHMVGGFFLNNELSDFSLPDAGEAVNEIAPGKRPRSAMAPTFLMRDGQLWGLVGSPGGALIIQYVVKTLLGLMVWNQHPQEAADLMNFGAMNKPLTWVGGDHPSFPTARAELLAGLSEHGHNLVATWSFASGISLAVRENDSWLVGIDPRREGTAWVG